MKRVEVVHLSADEVESIIGKRITFDFLDIRLDGKPTIKLVEKRLSKDVYTYLAKVGELPKGDTFYYDFEPSGSVAPEFHSKIRAGWKISGVHQKVLTTPE